MGNKRIGPREKSLGKRMCRVVTGHKPREKWGQHDHYGRMLYYYQCKRCGHLFWTEEAPSRREQPGWTGGKPGVGSRRGVTEEGPEPMRAER